MLMFCSALSQKKIILIDPGHGGFDWGAQSESGKSEKDIVLQIALKMVELNLFFGQDSLDIYLTRSKDQFISLSNRSLLVQGLDPDMFVSIHCNAAPAFAQGIGVFVDDSNWIQDVSNIRASTLLAHLLLQEVQEKLLFKNRGVKSANFQVLRETITNCPGVLIEIGFLTDELEGAYLGKSSSIDALALVILMSIFKFYTS
jgi:N-acetylmuramoyl-L-alanine amidase